MLALKIALAWLVLSVLFAWGWSRFHNRPSMQDMKEGE
jgi:hypothetical protein